MVKRKTIISSESVTEGHPDKMCDLISDAILDEALRQDRDSRVAIEAATKNGGVMVFGEMTTRGYIDIPHVVRNTIKDIGYTKSEYGIEWETCSVWVQITEQSPDISQGVTEKTGLHKEQGAGDQGMMYGYACRETKELMPLPISLAHKLCRQLAAVRKDGTLPYLRPDGKAQITVEYNGGVPRRIVSIVIGAQHDAGIERPKIERDVISHVIDPVIPPNLLTAETEIYVNSAGQFVIGGPVSDTGFTGRKIIVDSYGSACCHGGGAFSGKDPTKVDRSASYMARYAAKNLVAAGLADYLELQVAYTIGKARPLSTSVETFGTGKVEDSIIKELLSRHFDFRPEAIIRTLDLRRPLYRPVAAYGHFGRTDIDLPWERVDKATTLRKEAGL